MLHSRVLAFIIFAAYITNRASSTAASCNWLFGPAGPVTCIKISGYLDYQWATCLTNRYIKQKSNGNHECRSSVASYCYYQCMVEVYSKNDGFVYPKCRCDPKGRQVSTPTLPAKCFSPDGTDCSWYQQCLKKRYPCVEREGDEYAIKFGEEFCQLYTKQNSNFSSAAQRWIDAVRKCLQVKMVPLLRPWQNPYCETLKETAFQTTAACFLKPAGDNSVTACDLALRERMEIFWTLKAEFRSAFVPGLKQEWKDSLRCISKENERSSYREIQKTFSQFQLVIKRLTNYRLSRTRNKLDFFAGKVIDAIQLRQRWQQKGMAWFTFAATQAENGRLISIVAQLADRYNYEAGSSNMKRLSDPVDLNGTLIGLAEEVKNGNFYGLHVGSERDRIAIVEIKVCADWNCTEFGLNVTAPAVIESSPTSTVRKTIESTSSTTITSTTVKTIIPILITGKTNESSPTSTARKTTSFIALRLSVCYALTIFLLHVVGIDY